MEPMMLITLLALGLALFFAVEVFASRRRSASEEKVLKGYFLLGLSGLMAKIAQADGRVTNDEAEMANRFVNRMALTDAEKAICIGNFITARRDGLEPIDHVRRFLAYANASACEFLYDILWRISRVDGVVHPAEDKLLADIALYLGLGKAVYEDFKAGMKPSHDRNALKAAGVPPSLVALAR